MTRLGFLYVLLLLHTTPICAQIVSWSPMGAKSATFQPDNGPPLMRFLAPSATLNLRASTIIENDTKMTFDNSGNMTGSAEYDDPQKVLSFFIDASWDWTPDPILLMEGQQDGLDIPNDSPEGGTITITVCIGDKRDPADTGRHDIVETLQSVTYNISSACPDNIAVQSCVPLFPDPMLISHPDIGESYGHYIATMVAVGNPPAGRSSWNGTTVTESVGPMAAQNAADFLPNYIATANANAVSGSSFTFDVNNTFQDHHAFFGSIGLAQGVGSGVATCNQLYQCSAAKTYGPYVITRTWTYSPGPRNYVGVTKS